MTQFLFHGGLQLLLVDSLLSCYFYVTILVFSSSFKGNTYLEYIFLKAHIFGLTVLRQDQSNRRTNTKNLFNQPFIGQ